MTGSEKIRCEACGAGMIVGKSGFNYYPCPECRSLHLRPLPASETNDAFMSEEVAAEMTRIDLLRTPFLQRRLDMIPAPSKAVGSPRLLDVGCSSGHLMALARQSGWTVTGLEMSETLARKAMQANPEAKVLIGDVMKMDLTSLPAFQAVVALDVIEHVLAPGGFLRRLAGLMADDGYLLLQTPNAASLRARLHRDRWNMRIPEYHFHLFSPMGMKRMLQRNGFEMQRLVTASGSGMETGAAALLTRLKENLLNPGRLGNALLVLARKQPASGFDKK